MKNAKVKIIENYIILDPIKEKKGYFLSRSIWDIESHDLLLSVDYFLTENDAIKMLHEQGATKIVDGSTFLPYSLFVFTVFMSTMAEVVRGNIKFEDAQYFMGTMMEAIDVMKSVAKGYVKCSLRDDNNDFEY